MRLLTSYLLACWMAETIIYMIRWERVCELWRDNVWYVNLACTSVMFFLSPIIRPVVLSYRLYRRLSPKD